VGRIAIAWQFLFLRNSAESENGAPTQVASNAPQIISNKA